MLFLDEPTVGLDPRIRYELLDHIAGLRARSGMTILLTTHYLDEAEQLCDRVAVVHQGRVVALGSPAALLAALGPEVLELRIDGDVAAAVAALRPHGSRGRRRVHRRRHRPRAPARPPRPPAVAAIAELGLATAITSRPPTLDDVYLQLTGESLAA